jgi:hypothetical protein
MRAATNKAHPVELLEAILRAEVEHLAGVMGEVKISAPVNGHGVLSLDRRHILLNRNRFSTSSSPSLPSCRNATCRW